MSGAPREMLQTAAGKMIPTVYLITFASLFKYTSGMTPTNYEPIGNAYYKLEVAEQMIKSAKEKLLNNIQPLLPLDCEELFQNGEKTSGVHLVRPKNRMFPGSISVYCDMETDGGGWTVIQRRDDFGRRKDYFFQGWEAYKEGFGNLEEEFWLGNDKIYALSNQKLYSIRFDLGDSEGNKRYARYDTFWIEDESSNYKLHFTGYSGDAGDALNHHNGSMFSTKDRDNDNAPENCAMTSRGAWWYNKCHNANLNGEYHNGRSPSQGQGLIWNTWKGNHESLATTEIKIRKNPSWMP